MKSEFAVLLKNRLFAGAPLIYKLLRFLLVPLIPFYLLVFYAVSKYRKFCKLKKINIPVICIGNITTGGTGKTPSVLFLAEKFKEYGYKPGVVSRGYKGAKSKEGAIVSDGKKIYLTPEESGDEPYLISLKLREIPVSIGANRAAAAGMLADNFDIDIIIMDDGFQNSSIYKDISIVVIDAVNPFGNNLLLPAGDLREMKSSLNRSDLILINRSNLICDEKLTSLKKKLRKAAGHDHIFFSRNNICGIYQAAARDPAISAANLESKKILLVTGIGNPKSFYSLIEFLRPAKLKLLSYADHNSFTERDRVRILREAEDFDYILVTAKDHVKLKEYSFNNKLYIVEISLEIEQEKEFIDYTIDLLNNL